MPFIEMYVPEGTLDEQTKRTLHQRVSRQVLEAEGATYDESDLARAITWMVIHDVPVGSWSTGSEVLTADDVPRILTRVAVPQGALDDEKRRDIVARVNAEIVRALGDEFTDPTKSFCLIEENTFSGGGHVVTFDQLVEWLGLPHPADGDRPESVASVEGSG
jgi:phenylpyruvate tautomerase PptA (4-oxalocrotonate tautomerase family)